VNHISVPSSEILVEIESEIEWRVFGIVVQVIFDKPRLYPILQRGSCLGCDQRGSGPAADEIGREVLSRNSLREL